ncbi:tape measure protein [Mycobacterium phage 40AC]|uniref:Tape measure protein n=1 Tax=Mycobacterium phage 40AC TaxID=1458717 RepID=W8EAJ2_9CAUD|nr:tail length tape measure protein [Mycobacterium phage 40AC]AHJ86393.1 tape measure protein [Mycobacterium phage 40AC]
MPNSAGVEVARISVKVSPDTRKFRSELKKDLESIEKSVEGDVPITVHLDSAQARADFKRLLSQMRTEGRKGVAIKVHVGVDEDRIDSDTRRAAKKANKNFSRYGLDGVGDRLGKMFQMPNFGSGINPMGYVAILAGVVAVAAPLIGLLTTAILSLPGLISAITTPLMAVVLGLDGIKKAAADSGLINIGEDGEIGLGSVFDSIKQEVSSAFEIGLKGPLTDLKNAIPELLQSLPQVATGMSDMLKGFTDALTDPEGIRLFDDTIKNIAKAMSDSAPGINSFTTGMLKLANSLTQSFPGLTEWFNKTGDSFDKWITQMTTVDPATGKSQMNQAFEGLGDTLKTLGDFVVDLAKQGMEFVKDPQKMKDFIGTLENIGSAIEALISLGNKLGAAWKFLNDGPNGDQSGGPPILDQSGNTTTGTGSNSIAGTTEAVEEGNKQAQQGQEEQKGFWSSALGFLQKLVNPGDMANQAGGVQLVGPSGKTYANVQEMTNDLVNEANRLQGEIDKLQSTVSNQLEFHGGRETDRIREWKEELAELQSQAAEVKAAAEQAGVSLTTPPPGLTGPSGAQQFVDQFIGDLQRIPPAVQETLGSAQDQLTQGILSAESLGAISDGSAAPLIQAPQVDLKSFETSLAEMPAAMGEKGDETAQIAGEIPGKITAALGDLTGVGQTAGSQVAQGFIAGLAGGIPGVEAKARELAAAAKNAANAELGIRSPSKIFEQIGLFTAEGMGIGLEKGFQPVLDQAKDLSDKVTQAFAAGDQDPTVLLDGYSTRDVSLMEKTLNAEIKRLERQAKANKRLKNDAEYERLSAMADELKAQKEMLDLAGEFNEEVESGAGSLEEQVAKLMASPVDFAKATGKQFLSDIGINGDGFVSKLITEGTKYIFNIGSVDEAMDIKQRQESNDLLSVVGRIG